MKLHLKALNYDSFIEYEFLSNGRVKITVEGYQDNKLLKLTLEIDKEEWELFQKFLQN